MPVRCRRFVWGALRVALLWSTVFLLTSHVRAQDAAVGPRRWVVIVVGLPGDAEHEKLFRETTAAWSAWCEKTLLVPPERIRVLTCDAEVAKKTPEQIASRESLEKTLQALAGEPKAEDSLWLFTLGHGNFDGQRAQLHLPGPDLHAVQLAELLDKVPCREQVLWLTQATSGAWVKPLAREGRIVIAATADETEENETEFPHALAKVMQSAPNAIDEDQDQHVTLLELFRKTAAETQAMFDKDKRLATEHALLDDNADGAGTEIDKLAKASEPTEPMPTPSNVAAAPAKPRDGEIAGKLQLFAAPPEASQEEQENKVE